MFGRRGVRRLVFTGLTRSLQNTPYMSILMKFWCRYWRWLMLEINFWKGIIFFSLKYLFQNLVNFIHMGWSITSKITCGQTKTTIIDFHISFTVSCMLTLNLIMLLSKVKSLQFQHVWNVWKFSGQADTSNCPWITDWNFKILLFHFYLLYLYPNKEGKVFAKAALLLNCLVYMTDILFCKIVNQFLYCQSVFCLGDVSQLLYYCMVESA